MRWKSVALAGAFGPAMLGCNIAKYAARNVINEPLMVHTQVGITHDLRKQAKEAWREVRKQYPRRAFTAEFRDGFTDGFVDYLDRGGPGSMPAVPPAKYARNKKYFTEEGQCLVKDYFLGFKYGQEIAIATGQRQFLTVPVLLPEKPPEPPRFNVLPPNVVPHEIIPPPTTVVPTAPAEPPAKLPLPRPAPDMGSTPMPPAKVEPFPVPPPSPPEPTPMDINPPPVVEVSAVPLPFEVPLPPPPEEIPEFPVHIPTPSVLDDLPVVAPIHDVPPVVAPINPEDLGK